MPCDEFVNSDLSKLMNLMILASVGAKMTDPMLILLATSVAKAAYEELIPNAKSVSQEYFVALDINAEHVPQVRKILTRALSDLINTRAN